MSIERIGTRLTLQFYEEGVLDIFVQRMRKPFPGRTVARVSDFRFFGGGRRHVACFESSIMVAYRCRDLTDFDWEMSEELQPRRCAILRHCLLFFLGCSSRDVGDLAQQGAESLGADPATAAEVGNIVEASADKAAELVKPETLEIDPNEDSHRTTDGTGTRVLSSSRQKGDRMRNGTAAEADQQEEEIESAQRKSRQKKSNQIIESMEKSRQRGKHRRGRIRTLQDALDEYGGWLLPIYQPDADEEIISTGGTGPYDPTP